ncbi:MAG: hypothetical protein EAZ43_06120 [Betaproteobacteria bacterium]|nr:MAG: hypothetical protein EAZ43_06120 [Betaproteobacteria bacterium]
MPIEHRILGIRSGRKLATSGSQLHRKYSPLPRYASHLSISHAIPIQGALLAGFVQRFPSPNISPIAVV